MTFWEYCLLFERSKNWKNQAHINGKVEKSTRSVNYNRTFDDDIFGSSGSLFHFPWLLQEGKYHQRTSKSLAYLSRGQKIGKNAKMCIFAQKRQHLLNVRMDSCLNFKCNIIQYLLAVCVRYFWCLIHNSLLTHNQLLLSYKPCPNYVLTMSRPCPKIMSETYYAQC